MRFFILLPVLGLVLGCEGVKDVIDYAVERSADVGQGAENVPPAVDDDGLEAPPPPVVLPAEAQAEWDRLCDGSRYPDVVSQGHLARYCAKDENKALWLKNTWPAILRQRAAVAAKVAAKEAVRVAAETKAREAADARVAARVAAETKAREAAQAEARKEAVRVAAETKAREAAEQNARRATLVEERDRLTDEIGTLLRSVPILERSLAKFEWRAGLYKKNTSIVYASHRDYVYAEVPRLRALIKAKLQRKAQARAERAAVIARLAELDKEDGKP